MITAVAILRSGEVITASEEDAVNIIKIIEATASLQTLKLIVSTKGKFIELTSEKILPDTVIQTANNYCMTPKKDYATFNLFIINLLWGVYIESQKEPTITID